MLPDWYYKYKIFIDKSIEKFLINLLKQEKNSWLKNFKEAIFYSVKWGKRIRSILALEFYLIFSWKNFNELKENENIIKFFIAIELLHAYSLIHDDLPSMDNDEYRRWELTVWKNFWEANAILVWDFLNSLSFELLAEIWDIELIKYFWKSVWINWMIWWQVLDLYFEKNLEKLNLEKLIEIHNKKTWALIEFSIVGAIILTWKKIDLKKYKNFAQKIWLLFQIKDDLLDVEWNFEETWKSVWWEKKWFVYFLWLEKTKKFLEKIFFEIKEIQTEINSEKINFLINYIKNRKK